MKLKLTKEPVTRLACATRAPEPLGSLAWCYVPRTLVAIAISVVLSSSAFAETIIGRWCDRMAPNAPKYNDIMAMVAAGDGKVVLRLQFGDGSSTSWRLREIDGSTYEHIGSDTGDKFRIVKSTGELQLLDNDGIIRVAQRLENTPHTGECFQ